MASKNDVVIKFRTIEEAQKVVIPNITKELFSERDNLQKIIAFSNESKISKLRKVYALTDKVAATIAPYMVCQKGCSACCHIDVDVSVIEAQYIQKNTGHKFLDNDKRSSPKGERRPCTFLNGETCSIYENRPFPCRVYFTIDNPIYCEDNDKIHSTYGSQSNTIFRNLGEMIIRLNDNSAYCRDIRDYFPPSKE